MGRESHTGLWFWQLIIGYGTGAAKVRSDRFGLIFVLASLVAIAVVVAMVFENQHTRHSASTRAQGISLVRILSAVPYQQLTPGGSQESVMQVLSHGSASDDFAYVSIVDADGATVNEVVADGVIVPSQPVPAEPATWLAEKALSLQGDGRDIVEFHAPLLENGNLRGFVRLGFFAPVYGLTADQLPFLATVALSVFLLVPLFYLLVRMEVRPVRGANEQISRMLEGESFRRVSVTAHGELGEFMQRFNKFIEHAHERIELLEQDRNQLVTSSKLLSYKKSRAETVLETLPEAVLILDEAGEITFANQKLAAMFNVSRDVILTQSPEKWCDNHDVLHLLMQRQSNANARSLSDTVRFDVRRDSLRSVATRTYPLFSPKDPSIAIGTLIVFQDETQEALARQARVDFVAHLSHELKSPLNVLTLYSESLSSSSGDKKEFRIEAANVIASEVERLASLISGMLSMTQIETGSLAPEKSLVRLRDVAEAALNDVSHSDRAQGIDFKFDAPREMSPVFVDKDLIRIALDNLLSNAVKYNTKNGKVELDLIETDDAIQIRVADSGIGVSDDDEAKIFDKFYRSPDESVQKVNGHGLGLALAREIVELHQGTLSLNRSRECGTEFIINLWKEASALRQAI